MLKSLQQASTEELRALVDFARLMVVKEQEIADFAEEAALRRSGAMYVPNASLPRDWEQVVAYAQPSTTNVLTKIGPRWLYRSADSVATMFAVDETGNLWQRVGAASWIAVITGQVRTSADASWPQFAVPAGESYVDPQGTRYLIPLLVWLDHTTGDISAIGPGSGEFVTEAVPGTAHPDGLSDLINTPQEYVTALLRVATGSLVGAELAAMQAAIESFEAPGPWEDVRQPFFASDSIGNLALGETGIPMRNPLRVVDVAYRGELNDYYRKLVRDNGISPYVSRTAGQFEVISWTAVSGLSPTEIRHFVSSYSESVRVFKSAFYSEALESDPLYFKYCRTFIAWMTIIRTVNERMGGIGDIDRMTSYDLTNLLYSYGVYQFDDMPVVYRRRLAKSLEKILSVKGTTQVFRDILGIFNLDKDISIWKHYLVRYYPTKDSVLQISRVLTPGEAIRVVLASTVEYVSETVADLVLQLSAVESFRSVTAAPDGLSIIFKYAEGSSNSIASAQIVEFATLGIIEDCVVTTGDTDYGLPEVGFQRVDIDDPVAESTVSNMDTAYLSDYDEFVSRDETWETSRADARQLAFSVLQTKYFSMNSAVDAVHNGMALAVLWGMLKDAQARGRTGAMLIEGASAIPGVVNMNLFEGFVAAMTLTLWRFGVDDLIPHDESGISTITAARTDGTPFPNEGNLLPYSTVLKRVADAPDPLYSQAMTDMMDHNIELAVQIDNAVNATGREDTVGGYDPLRGGEESRTVKRNEQLRNMWDHKFISTYTTDAFGSTERYSDFLDRINPELAQWVRDTDAAGDHTNGILQLTLLIEDSIDSNRLNLPIALGMNDIVMTYIERLVRFFKAYTTDLRNFSTFLLIDRPAVESLRLMNLLAGLNVSWSRDDTLEDLHDLLHKTVTSWTVSEAKNSGLLLDVFSALSELKKQDIARILDSVPSWFQLAMQVSPAPKMRDTATFTVSGSRRDALTISTRSQRPGDINTYKLTDAYGLFHPTTSTFTNPADPLIPPELDDETGTVMDPALVIRADLNATSRPRPQGLGDGALIIPIGN